MGLQFFFIFSQKQKEIITKQKSFQNAIVIQRNKSVKLTGQEKPNLKAIGFLNPCSFESKIVSEFSPKTGVTTSPNVQGEFVSI